MVYALGMAQPLLLLTICASDDEEQLAAWDRHLSALKAELGLVHVHARAPEILPGSERGRQLEEALGRADICVLLLSVDLLSDENARSLATQALARLPGRVLGLRLRTGDYASWPPIAGLPLAPAEAILSLREEQDRRQEEAVVALRRLLARSGVAPNVRLPAEPAPRRSRERLQRAKGVLFLILLWEKGKDLAAGLAKAWSASSTLVQGATLATAAATTTLVVVSAVRTPAGSTAQTAQRAPEGRWARPDPTPAVAPADGGLDLERPALGPRSADLAVAAVTDLLGPQARPEQASPGPAPPGPRTTLGKPRAGASDTPPPDPVLRTLPLRASNVGDKCGPKAARCWGIEATLEGAVAVRARSVEVTIRKATLQRMQGHYLNGRLRSLRASLAYFRPDSWATFKEADSRSHIIDRAIQSGEQIELGGIQLRLPNTDQVQLEKCWLVFKLDTSDQAPPAPGYIPIHSALDLFR